MSGEIWNYNGFNAKFKKSGLINSSLNGGEAGERMLGEPSSWKI